MQTPSSAVAREYAATLSTAAVIVGSSDATLDSWGQVDRKLFSFAVRKSLVSPLVGIAIHEGRFALNTTLADLGVDDDPPLAAEEKQATIRDLVTSRSGVYHASVAEPQLMAMQKPPRGSHQPGEHWYYNNWDFNALCTILERVTGRSLFEQFVQHIADPLDLDVTPEDGRYVTGPESVHWAYELRMRPRDLLRFGQLYLRLGEWNGQQVVPETWVRESTHPHSDAGSYLMSDDSYGYMWWVRAGNYSARGKHGQYLEVLPEIDRVVVHMTSPDVSLPEEERRGVSWDEYAQLRDLLLRVD